MMRKYLYIILVGGFLSLLSACVNGRDDVFNPLPDIEIGDMNKAGLPLQVTYGDTLRLNPTITYGNEGAEAFDFHWYVKHNNSLTLLSTDPVLVQRMDSLGIWNFYLEVTNKQTQVSNAVSFSTMVLSRSQRGWYVLKENAEENTDIDIFQVTETGKDSGRVRDVIKQDNVVFRGKPVGLYYDNEYSWKAPGENSFTNYQSLIPVSEQDFGALQLTTADFMETTDKMFYDNVDKVSEFTGGLANTDQILLVNSGKLHLMPTQMQAFLPAVLWNNDYSLSPYFTVSNVSGTSTLGFDDKSRSFVYINKMANQLYTFPDKYLKGKTSSNHMNGTLSFLENMDGSLNPDTVYSQRAYALFHEDNREDRCILLGLDLAQVDASQYQFGNGQFSPIMDADTILYSRVPALKDADILALHKTAPNLYIANGNTISRYDVQTHAYRANVKTFPADETITYMHYIVNQYDTYNGVGNTFENLVVATYKSDGTYRIYRFRIAGDNFTQQGNIYTGEGKVKTLLYVSPYATMVNNIYRYY